MKNFTVKTERIKNKSGGTSKYLNYLNDKNHPHHQGQDIINIHGNASSFLNIASHNALSKDIQTIENKRGGRAVESYCQSFCFSFPPGINVTEETLKNDSKEIINTFKENFPNIKDNEIYINAHIGGKNPHINVLVARVNYDEEKKEYVSNNKLDQKGITHKCKIKFNEIMKNNHQLSVENYKPERENCNEKLWSARLKKQQELEAYNKKMEEYNEKLTQRVLEQKEIVGSNINLIKEQENIYNDYTIQNKDLIKQNEELNKNNETLKNKAKSIEGMSEIKKALADNRKKPSIPENIFENDIKKDIKKDGLGF